MMHVTLTNNKQDSSKNNVPSQLVFYPTSYEEYLNIKWNFKPLDIIMEESVNKNT